MHYLSFYVSRIRSGWIGTTAAWRMERASDLSNNGIRKRPQRNSKRDRCPKTLCRMLTLAPQQIRCKKTVLILLDTSLVATLAGSDAQPVRYNTVAKRAIEKLPWCKIPLPCRMAVFTADAFFQRGMITLNLVLIWPSAEPLKPFIDLNQLFVAGC